MWKKNSFAEINQDSDQSISEEEGLDPEDFISLGGPVEKKEGIQIQSQLELLRGTGDQRQTGLFIEDNVEVPVFRNECDFVCSRRRSTICNTYEEIIPDVEVKKNNVLSLLIPSGAKDLHQLSPSFQSEKGNIACTWSGITKEAEALFLLNENAGCCSSHAASSKFNKSYRGGRAKAKPKFSFHIQSRKEDVSWPVNSKDGSDMSYSVLSFPEELETSDHRSMENSMAELLENSDGEKKEQKESFAIPPEVALGHNYAEHSMAELLDGYQEKNGLLRVNSEVSSGTKGRAQLVVRRSVSTLADRNVDDNDLPEALDSGPSSDDEANLQDLKVMLLGSKGKSMADQFQEALGAVCVNDEDRPLALPGQSRSGLFGKLQQVMQSEKGRDMEFLQSLQTGASFNEASCIDVKILSRCLEARLTVCHCSLSRVKESYHGAVSCPIAVENEEQTLTVIFSSRVCSDVEFEVGNLIRIHSPWKEVRVSLRDKIIILSAYFSQISVG